MSKKPSLSEALKPYSRTPAATEPASRGDRNRGEARDEKQTRVPLPPSRVGKKAIACYFDPAVSKQLKRIALDRDLSVQALLSGALATSFRSTGQEAYHGVKAERGFDKARVVSEIRIGRAFIGSPPALPPSSRIGSALLPWGYPPSDHEYGETRHIRVICTKHSDHDGFGTVKFGRRRLSCGGEHSRKKCDDSGKDSAIPKNAQNREDCGCRCSMLLCRHEVLRLSRGKGVPCWSRRWSA